MNMVFPRLYRYVDMRRRTRVIVRGVVVGMPDGLSRIFSGMDVTPSKTVRSISVGSHVASERGCPLCNSPELGCTSDTWI